MSTPVRHFQQEQLVTYIKDEMVDLTSAFQRRRVWAIKARRVVPIFLSQLIAMLVFSGCASEKLWYQSGKSAEEARRDYAQCKLLSEREANPLAMLNLGFALADGSRKEAIVKNCMIAKGYTEIDKDSMPNGLNSSGVNVQQQSAADMAASQKLIGHWVSVSLSAKITAERLEFTFYTNQKCVSKTIWRKGEGTNSNTEEGTYRVLNGKLIFYHADEAPAPAIFYFVDDILVIKPSDVDYEMRYKRTQ